MAWIAGAILILMLVVGFTGSEIDDPKQLLGATLAVIAGLVVVSLPCMILSNGLHASYSVAAGIGIPVGLGSVTLLLVAFAHATGQRGRDAPAVRARIGLSLPVIVEAAQTLLGVAAIIGMIAVQFLVLALIFYRPVIVVPTVIGLVGAALWHRSRQGLDKGR